jgi:hypothetical protein
MVYFNMISWYKNKKKRVNTANSNVKRRKNDINVYECPSLLGDHEPESKRERRLKEKINQIEEEILELKYKEQVNQSLHILVYILILFYRIQYINQHSIMFKSSKVSPVPQLVYLVL